MNKFEEMLERLINEDKAGAEELFHEIVVEKSRSIYENLLAEEYEEDEEVEEADHDDEDDDDDDEEVSEDFDLDEFEVAEEEPEDPMAAIGGDETDDLEMDISMGDEGGEMDMDMDMGDEGEEELEDRVVDIEDALDELNEMDMDMDMGDEGEEELEDRVVDIEDALDELKAEFEKMMSGDEDADSDMDDMDDMDDAEADDIDDTEADDMDDMDDEGEEEEKEAFDPTDQVATMREYVEKVTAKMGDDGVQKQSTVAGKNDMGGTADNIARADTENGVEANKGNLKGSALSDQNPKDMNTGNVNVPGGKASKSMKNQPKGHGSEKKGSGETADNKQSTLRARK